MRAVSLWEVGDIQARVLGAGCFHANIMSATRGARWNCQYSGSDRLVVALRRVQNTSNLDFLCYF